MAFYHVTLLENLESILDNGLFASKGGLDGKGVYLWKGPLEEAVREADLSLLDNHSEMSLEEYETFSKGLVMLSVDVPDDVTFSVEWSEYVVWDTDVVPRERLAAIGSFAELLERFPPRQDVAQIVAEAEVRAGFKEDTTNRFPMREFEIS